MAISVCRSFAKKHYNCDYQRSEFVQIVGIFSYRVRVLDRMKLQKPCPSSFEISMYAILYFSSCYCCLAFFLFNLCSIAPATVLVQKTAQCSDEQQLKWLMETSLPLSKHHQREVVACGSRKEWSVALYELGTHQSRSDCRIFFQLF